MKKSRAGASSRSEFSRISDMQSSAQEEDRQPLGLPVRQQVYAVAVLAGIALLVALFFVFVRGGGGTPTQAMPQLTTPKLVTFIPTSRQLATLQLQTVGRRTFHTEIVTDGYVAPNGGLAAAGSGGAVSSGLPILAGQSSDLLQAESDLVTANAQFKLAQANEVRQHQLFDNEGAAQKDWQQSQFDLANAAAALASARNRLRLMGKTDGAVAGLEKAALRAQKNPGASTVFAIGDLSRVWLVGNVREADAALVALGDRVEVLVPAYPQMVLHATVGYIAPVIDPATHRLVIGAEVHNDSGKLKPNMLATFTIEAGQAVDAPAIPQQAIVYEGDASRVWVANRRGDLTLRSVTLGRSSGGYAEVTGGLAPGEQIVTSGALFIDQAAATN
jgi:cobalt-zinc-cadmium efflux system membrane fusion protein